MKRESYLKMRPLHRYDFCLTVVNPTAEQIEWGLTDENYEIRGQWAKRMDFTPTPEQIERGLKDGECEIRECFEKNLTRWQKDILTTQFKPQKFKRQAL